MKGSVRWITKTPIRERTDLSDLPLKAGEPGFCSLHELGEHGAVGARHTHTTRTHTPHTHTHTHTHSESWKGTL